MANAWNHPDAAASGCFILFVGDDVLIDPRREAAWQERRHEGMTPYGCRANFGALVGVDVLIDPRRKAAR